MAKTSVINRNEKRAAVVRKYAARRAELKAAAVNVNLSEEQRYAAQLALQKLPRDASPVRLVSRCQATGRHTACTRNSASGATSCAKHPCAAMCRAWSRPAGKAVKAYDHHGSDR